MPDVEQRELEIGKRICEWREKLNWSQAALANSPLSLSKNQIANIESGRTALRYDLGDRFCSFFGLSQRWLALGTEPICPYVPVPEHIKGVADGFDSAPFSRNYDAFLATHCDDFFALKLDSVTATLKSLAVWEPIDVNEWHRSGPAQFHESVLRLVTYLVRVVPPRFYSGLLQGIGAACGEIIAKEASLISKFLKAGEVPSTAIPASEVPALLAARRALNTNSLTSYPDTNTMPSVMTKQITSWPELRERLVALTCERGAKAALAREFHVTPQAVGEWVRGLSMPNADATIRLLPWVAMRESETARAAKSSQTKTPRKRARR